MKPATVSETKHTPTASDDEPYDRNTKMQHFVAAQQALARTGKTVLHNPELHRVRVIQEEEELTSPEGSTASPSLQSTLSVGGPASLRQKVTNIVRPPPGFEATTPKPTLWYDEEDGEDD
jgi:hypothetical protein